MANRGDDQDWARQVPQRRFRGPYRDYGWESGESALPEFRDPSVHEMPWDRERGNRERSRNRDQGDYRSRSGNDYDYGQEQFRRSPYDYGQEDRYRTAGDWNTPGPFTGRGPRGYRRSDERIREDVVDRLAQHGWIDASEIEVNVTNGEVTLQGAVDNRRTKRMAEDVAESVTGVNDVRNELRIQARSQEREENKGTGI